MRGRGRGRGRARGRRGGGMTRTRPKKKVSFYFSQKLVCNVLVKDGSQNSVLFY